MEDQKQFGSFMQQRDGELLKIPSTNVGINRRDVLKMAGAALAAGVVIPGSSLGAPLENKVDGTGPRLDQPVLFPAPQEIKILEGAFKVDNETFLLLPTAASVNDLHLSRTLSHELSDWFDLQLRIRHAEKNRQNMSAKNS